MIIKKNSQKYREVRRRIEPADFENKPVETAEIEPEEKELPVEQQEEAEEIAEPVVNLPKEPEIDLFDIENIDFVFSECKRILKTGGILYYSIVHPAFYDCHWLKDAKGYKHAKVIDKYIKPYQLTNEFWGETEHFHRPLSHYLNIAAKNGFALKRTCEPVSYDGVNKNSDLPLFFFAEYIKEE